MPQETVQSSLATVRENIAVAAKRAGRSASDITLIAASKTQSVEKIVEAATAGQVVFGENYVQEAVTKIAAVKQRGVAVEFHLIGSLQRNKVKQALGAFSLIHGVDRLELAQEISKVAARNTSVVQAVLIQINISGEASKSGIAPDKALELCRSVLGLPGLAVRGLMTIGQLLEEASEEVRRDEFRTLRELRDEIQRKVGHPLPELSMGMSNDYQIAIEEGATLVRVGSAIFGMRG